MRVLVLGAGVVGATTAYMLARDGHEVTVLDRAEGPGLETSFANGGQVSASHAEPWASPHSLLLALKWLGRKDAPLAFPLLHADPALWAWTARFLRNCTAARVRVNMERTLRVAAYSRACLKDLNNSIPLDYDRRTAGILHVYRDPREFERARKSAAEMEGLGLKRQALTPSQCRDAEPALTEAAPNLAGGLFSPDDESGDAFKFTNEMARLAREHGATFTFGVTILGLNHAAGQITEVLTDRGAFTADAYVLALASYSPALVKRAGLALPVYPAKGYSLTVPSIGPGLGLSVTDDEHKMVFSCLGGRLRAAGTAEFSGWNRELSPQRTALIERHTRRLFPKAADYAAPVFWCGLRPVTPDSAPLIGRTPGLSNLWLNTGHGTLGWTMAVGSARLIADLAANRPTDISLEGLGVERFD